MTHIDGKGNETLFDGHIDFHFGRKCTKKLANPPNFAGKKQGKLEKNVIGQTNNLKKALSLRRESD